VEVHKLRRHGKPTLMLGSDRDSGLWIFKYQEDRKGHKKRN
jgi:hypothetical protein